MYPIPLVGGRIRYHRRPLIFASSPTQSCSGSASTFLPSGKRELPAWTTNSRCNRRRSEEHTSELQSQSNLVCRLLLEKKKKKNNKERQQEKTKKIKKKVELHTINMCHTIMQR